MVIDWGNGRIQKIEDPSSMSGGVVYRYGNKGLYEVRIWAEELQLIDISGLLLPLSHLYLGNMPRMKSLALNSISLIWSIWRLRIVSDCDLYKFILIPN